MTLAGNLEDADCEPLEDALDWPLQRPGRSVLIDLSQLAGINRYVVYTILLATLRAEDQRHEILIVPGPRAVQDVLDRLEGPFRYLQRGDFRR